MSTSDASFERAYLQYLPAVSGYLFRRVQRQEVEDLAADVFAIAWRKRASVTPGEELPWLYRIAANVVANHRRKQASGAAFFASLRPADSSPSAEDIVVADASLAAAWQQLRPSEREVLALALVEELPPAELAVALAVSVNAATIRVHRAKKRLGQLLVTGGTTPVAAPLAEAPPTDSALAGEAPAEKSENLTDPERSTAPAT